MKIGELLEHFHGDNWIIIHDRHLYKTSVYKRRGVLEKYGNCEVIYWDIEDGEIVIDTQSEF